MMPALPMPPSAALQTAQCQDCALHQRQCAQNKWIRAQHRNSRNPRGWRPERSAEDTRQRRRCSNSSSSSREETAAVACNPRARRLVPCAVRPVARRPKDTAREEPLPIALHHAIRASTAHPSVRSPPPLPCFPLRPALLCLALAFAAVTSRAERRQRGAVRGQPGRAGRKEGSRRTSQSAPPWRFTCPLQQRRAASGRVGGAAERQRQRGNRRGHSQYAPTHSVRIIDSRASILPSSSVRRAFRCRWQPRCVLALAALCFWSERAST
jgi:hypothetical protein